MGKKIVVIRGSPRADGNSAARAAAFFVKAAEEKGHGVTRFDAAMMNVGGCRGCWVGGKNPESPCVQKDDMEQIYPAYKEADVVVLASPLYYWTISGQLKRAFDRLFAVAECDPIYTNPRKESALLMAAEGNGFEETVYWYDRLMGHIGWKDWGKALCGGVMAVGDIDGKPELEEARKLGASIK